MAMVDAAGGELVVGRGEAGVVVLPPFFAAHLAAPMRVGGDVGLRVVLLDASLMEVLAEDG